MMRCSKQLSFATTPCYIPTREVFWLLSEQWASVVYVGCSPQGGEKVWRTRASVTLKRYEPGIALVAGRAPSQNPWNDKNTKKTEARSPRCHDSDAMAVFLIPWINISARRAFVRIENKHTRTHRLRWLRRHLASVFTPKKNKYKKKTLWYLWIGWHFHSVPGCF